MLNLIGSSPALALVLASSRAFAQATGTGRDPTTVSGRDIRSVQQFGLVRRTVHHG